MTYLLYCLLLKVENFTDAGKKCLLRLQKQIALRLPPPCPMDCLPVLLDPATKAFRSWLLEDNELLQVTTSLLKAKHLKAYEALNSKSNNQDVVDLENLPSDNEEEKGGNSNDINQDSSDDEDEDGNSEGHGIVLDEESVSSSSADLTGEANAVFEKWINSLPTLGIVCLTEQNR